MTNLLITFPYKVLCLVIFYSLRGYVSVHVNSNYSLQRKLVSLAFGTTIFFNSNIQHAAANWFSFGQPLYETAADIPSNILREKKEINGRVISISDGDTYRIRHLNGQSNSEKFDGPIKYHTIIVRIYAVDTPEIAKFGNSGQPFSQESKDFVVQKLMNQKIKVKCLSRDQYGRLLGVVKYQEKGFLGLSSSEKDISEELLKSGLAVVYRSGGANYDGKGVKYFNGVESIAKTNKFGIWSLSDDNFESPSDYKKKTKGKSNTEGNKKNKRKTFTSTSDSL